MCVKAVSEDLCIIKHCLDRYKTREMCDKAADDFLPTLKFVPDCFATSWMIKKLHNALFTDDDILFFFEEDCVILHFLMIKWVFLV